VLLSHANDIFFQFKTLAKSNSYLLATEIIITHHI